MFCEVIKIKIKQTACKMKGNHLRIPRTLDISHDLGQLTAAEELAQHHLAQRQQTLFGGKRLSL